MIEKVDLKKQLKHLYNPSKNKFVIIDVPPMNFLMIEGHGDPNISVDYAAAIQALYSVSYTLKFMIKATGIDYPVMALEGLWWMENMADFGNNVKDQWDWTMMIMQPEWVTNELVEKACLTAGKKKDIPSLSKLHFELYTEGLSFQTLYLGTYADEGPTIARMHTFIHESGYQLQGKHHEIYLGNPQRMAPEKLKTIIRQPVLKM
jgi:hypothetical protein